MFEPGDVFGFYIKSHGEGGGKDDNIGVVLLNDSSHTSELVWFGRIDITAQPSPPTLAAAPTQLEPMEYSIH